MCGIAGIIANNSIEYKNSLKEMTDAMQHRGPDAENFLFFPNAALGHRRLSIIDLSNNGNQPMLSDTKEQAIVLNGEIYGYKEIKKEFPDYPFQSNTDTEVILAMYRRYGVELLSQLPGMFAFAIWDNQKQELLCARDRFGEKPFYYAIGSNNQFIFASEIKSILASGLVNPQVDRASLFDYLKNGYISSHKSIYSNIYSLPPAHFLTLSNGEIKTKRYYHVPRSDLNISLSEAKEEFDHLLKKAVQKQMVADVEVGSFLSGGLDSSTIVAATNEFAAGQTTISFGYNNEKSELKYAREIAEKYQTNHIEVNSSEENLAENLLKITPFFDEPLADISFTPLYQICESAAKNLKVVLSGDVGDELFGGYHFYTVEREMKEHFSYQNRIAQFGYKMLKNFKKPSFIAQSNMENKGILDFHQNKIRQFFSEKEIENLGITEQYYQPYSFQPGDSNLNDIMRVDLEKYVPGNMLAKSDRMSMANSLEVRIPFLDTEFANFCIQLPDNLKINSDNDKIILRESMQHYWTDSIRNRKKQGFGLKPDIWMKEKELRKLSDALLKNEKSKIFDFIDFQYAQSFLDLGKKHWNLLILALWAENYKKYL